MITLQDKSIIHLVDLRRVTGDTIGVNFRPNWWDRDDAFGLKVKPSTVIKTALERQLRPFIGGDERNVFLAYLGKPLNIFKTFVEAMVEDQA